MRRLSPLPIALLVTLCGGAGSAAAGTLYQNTPIGSDGDCIFNTSCESAAGSGTVYGGQQFTTSGGTARALGFYSIDLGSPAYTAVNWLLLSNDGTGGLPGMLLASGTSGTPILLQSAAGTPYTSNLWEFDIPAVDLAPGSYTVAFNAVTSTFSQYLSDPGVDTANRSVQSSDGGATWSFDYATCCGLTAGSVAAVVFDTPVGAPEPASLVLLGVGLAGTSLLRRRA